MFEKLREKIESENFNYRENIYEIGKVAENPSSVYILFDGSDYVVGTTTPRNFLIGVKKYHKESDAENDFMTRIQADRKAFYRYKERGSSYPESPI